MKTSEKIQRLKAVYPGKCHLMEYYQDIFESFGDIKYNYGDYLTTKPIDCDEELKRVPTADYELCCALLTMLFREDHFSWCGSFGERYKNGDVQRIVDRMITVLEEKEASIKRRLAGRAAECWMFKDD